jgi:ABC-type bacteriocin/lantibiotic exporter with double-glycine peptidase domain/CRP-like cAMP-binding protein
MSRSDTRAADVDALRGLPLLAGVPEPVRELVMASFVAQEHAFGDEVVRQGDAPDGLYVVAEGRLRVVRADGGAEAALGTLRPGDTFGEAGLLDGRPRQATVRASERAVVLRLDPALFLAIARRHPEVRERLGELERARRIGPLLRAHPVFSVLTAADVQQLVPELGELMVRAGETVFGAGDPPGPLYLVTEGRLRVTADEGSTLGYLRSGDVFGELSAYAGTPRAATVEAISDARLAALRADAFTALVDAHPAVAERVAEQLAFYERGPSANVPLDFADELLPAAARHTPPPDASADVAERPAAGPTAGRRLGLRRRRHVPHVRQLDAMDCGAACLSMACRAFGHPVPHSHIREVAGTAVDGTSLRGIERGGAAVGLEIRPLKVSRERLDELALPAIVHWRGVHWMVLDEVQRNRVHIADPSSSSKWIDRGNFLEHWTGYCAVVAPTDRLRDAPRDRADLRWMWPFARPHVRALAGVVALSLLMSTVQMLVPVLTGQIIDKVLAQSDLARLNVLAAAMLGLILLALVASIAQARVLSAVAVRIDRATLDHIATRLLRLPMGYFEARRTGDIERRLDGMREVREFAVQQGSGLLAGATQLAVALVLMLLISPLLGLIWLATTPAYIVLMRTSTRRLRPAFEELEEGFAVYRSRQIDGIRGIESVKSLGAEDSLRRRMGDDFEELAVRVLKADRTAVGYTGLVNFVTATLLLLFLYLGTRQVLAGNLTVGELVAFNSLVLLANGPVVALLSLWDQWQVASVLLGRMQDILDQEPEQAGATALRPVPTLAGRVALAGVGFTYPSTPDVPILDAVTIDVRAGMTVAIVGRSGSGKSTLLRCVAGLLPITNGTITFDGVDLTELDWPQLRRRIGLVPQHPHVFDDTIAANIAFADDEPDPDAVRAAAEIADAHDFIERLPLGYATRVGDGGMRLSGGQAQRLAIARAVYRRPPLILLDEATSALDAESERTVTQNMARLIEGRTALIVAHRLSTVREADLIVVLERGRVAETGTHDHLLAREGLYFHLYGQQLNA